jgi:beta-lactamase class D
MNAKARMTLCGAALALTVHTAAGAAARCIEIIDAASGQRLVHDGDCEQRFPPMSTFKVAISLMGYDSGVLRDAHAPRLPFKKGYADWIPDWRKATDPTDWMTYSVVWYSRQITARLGERRFEDYVKRFNFGNMDVTGDPGKHNGLSQSWLESSLQITPVEQVAFLRRVVKRELGLSPHAYDMTAQLMKVPTLTDGWQVYGKTGSGSPHLPDGSSDNAHAFGWYVGWATKGERTIIFAKLAQDEKEVAGPFAGRRARDAFLRELPALLAGQ